MNWNINNIWNALSQIGEKGAKKKAAIEIFNARSLPCYDRIHCIAHNGNSTARQNRREKKRSSRKHECVTNKEKYRRNNFFFCQAKTIRKGVCGCVTSSNACWHFCPEKRLLCLYFLTIFIHSYARLLPLVLTNEWIHLCHHHCHRHRHGPYPYKHQHIQFNQTY